MHQEYMDQFDSNMEPKSEKNTPKCYCGQYKIKDDDGNYVCPQCGHDDRLASSSHSAIRST